MGLMNGVLMSMSFRELFPGFSCCDTTIPAQLAALDFPAYLVFSAVSATVAEAEGPVSVSELALDALALKHVVRIRKENIIQKEAPRSTHGHGVPPELPQSNGSIFLPLRNFPSDSHAICSAVPVAAHPCPGVRLISLWGWPDIRFC